MLSGSAAALAAWSLFATAGLLAGTPDPVLELDLGGAAVETATPVPVAPTPLPAPLTLAPTITPVPVQPAITVSGSAAELTPTPDADLRTVRFDKAAPEEDGLMIIAPGAASPEDSLESFGIDSPFNWKERRSRTLEPGKDAAAAAGEDLELSAPDASDLRDRVSVENGEGEAQPSDADYDAVERAGGVLNASEYRMDGVLARNKDGQIFARQRVQVALRMEPGRQVYPGSLYTVFRDAGVLSTQGDDAHEVGMLVRNVGVLKVTRIEGDEVLAKVEKQYDAILEGDRVRLRDPERLRYYSLLRQGPPTVPLDLHGQVIGVRPPALFAREGNVIYLDIGRAQGVVPGLRLMLFRPAEDLGTDGIRKLEATGRLGVVEVINVSHDACAARVVQCPGEVLIGDKVRYR